MDDDEVQKIPQILDEVHSLIFDYNGMVKFALTGSSARKLKHENIKLPYLVHNIGLY